MNIRRALPVKDLALSFGPAVVGLVAVTVAIRQALLPAPTEQVLPIVAAVVFGAGALMALRFSRSRALLVLAWLGALYVLVAGLAPPWVPRSPLLLPCIALATPVVFALVASVRERGVASVPTAVHLGALALALAAFGRWATTRGAGAIVDLQEAVVPELGAVGGRLATLLTLAAALLVFGLWVQRRTPLLAGFAGATLAAGAALALPGPYAPVYLLCAALVVLISLVETSYGLAFRDALTRLPSRRALDEDADKLPRRFVVAMVDIDHFKKLNDKHGHDVGDQALAAVASVLAAVGGGGRAYRYGGEEFVIVFPRKRVERVEKTVEALRKRIQERRIRVRGTKAKGTRLSVTVSIGVAEAATDRRQFDKVLKAADKALYRAKRGGRNQVATS
jgi:diguanylate cyclase (GGDEF)-like protein